NPGRVKGFDFLGFRVKRDQKRGSGKAYIYTFPPEVRSLGRTLKRWKDHIVAWHRGRRTNGPTEAVNNLIKRTKRIAFGFPSFRSFRVRALLYAGRPNWDLLATITPR